MSGPARLLLIVMLCSFVASLVLCWLAAIVQMFRHGKKEWAVLALICAFLRLFVPKEPYAIVLRYFHEGEGTFPWGWLLSIGAATPFAFLQYLKEIKLSDIAKGTRIGITAAYNRLATASLLTLMRLTIAVAVISVVVAVAVEISIPRTERPAPNNGSKQVSVDQTDDSYQVVERPAREVPQPSAVTTRRGDYLTLYSSKQEVLAICGEPLETNSKEDGDLWDYGPAGQLTLSPTGFVRGWRIPPAGGLDVRILGPGGSPIQTRPGAMFGMGSDRFDVVSAQGTPNYCLGEEWGYQVRTDGPMDLVKFSGKEVVGWDNRNGSLHLFPKSPVTNGEF